MPVLEDAIAQALITLSPRYETRCSATILHFQIKVNLLLRQHLRHAN
jgi:hypothetical protein